AAHDVIAHARQIFHAAAANQHQRVLLEVVAHTRDVGRHLDAVGQPHASHLAQRRVRLLRRLREDAHAHAALLWAVLQRRTLGLAHNLRAAVTDKLTDGWHGTITPCDRLAEAAQRRRRTASKVCVEPKSQTAWRPTLIPYSCVSRVSGGLLRGS